MSLQFGRAFILFFFLFDRKAVKEYRRQAEHKCLYLDGKGLESLFCRSAGRVCVARGLGRWVAVLFLCTVFENGQIAPGPYKHLLNLLLPYPW